MKFIYSKCLVVRALEHKLGTLPTEIRSKQTLVFEAVSYTHLTLPTKLEV